MEPLPRAFFDRPVLEIAPDLLGRVLVRSTPEGEIALRITETEAYAGETDPGSHAYRGRTNRNAAMYGPPGHAYVYFIYGAWHCINVVCGPEGQARAVLLRAGEVQAGAAIARARRATARRHADLARGPARLTTALGIDRSLDGADVCGEGSGLRLLAGAPTPSGQVSQGPRTGIAGPGAAALWRFWITGDSSVSPYRAARPRRPRAQLDSGASRS